ncbi:MAG: RidA family protein [Emergencia sp.]|uniref:RidA family protein n=1 Tax=Emergencia sp. JLR.KK010 TaxID=3114296 RepID=UPI00216F4941|nr:RidA family protein [Emergencia sp.]
MMDVEKKLAELGIDLSAGPEPMANYVSVQKAGGFWFFSGAGPFENGKPVVFGRLGENLTTKEGYDAARLAGINLLAVLKRELGGDWDKLEQIVKVQGFVNSTTDYFEQPLVINGVSDLFGEVLGDRGRHARTAVGTNVLPFRIPLEVEMIVKVKE